MMRAAAALALGALALAGPAHAEVTLANAWMRPAYAGQPHAEVYVDIRAARPLRLVAAATPAAKRVDIVRVDAGDAAGGRVVAELAVAANVETRLALGGSHLRLADITQEAKPSDLVALTLTFADAAGKRQTAQTQVLVRGLLPRRPPEAAEPVK